MVFIINIGYIIAFTLGSYCDFYATPKAVIALTLVYVVLICFFPETPAFLMQQNKITVSITNVYT